MSKAKQQHWVPQFYLRYFSTPDTVFTNNPQVWIFSKDENDGNESLTNIKNICGKRFLYSPKNNEGQRSWGLEDKLSNLEKLLSEIWEQLAIDFIDLSNPAIRKALALFVSVMYLRHPDNLNKAKIVHKNIVNSFERCPKNPDGTPHINAIAINGKLFNIDVSGWHDFNSWGTIEHHRLFIDQVHQATDLAEILMKKRWSVIFTESNQFITSDKPIFKEHLKKKIFGLDTEGTIISFPLSQRRLLVMDDFYNEPANQYYPLNAGTLGIHNFNIWHNAKRFMISGRPIIDVLNEIITDTKKLAR